jgi:hypothetical protein
MCACGRAVEVGTVVEHLTTDPEIKGLNTAAARYQEKKIEKEKC